MLMKPTTFEHDASLLDRPGNLHSPSNSSAKASTAAWIGAHRSSTASRSGEQDAVALLQVMRALAAGI
jgi:hypothetical protein